MVQLRLQFDKGLFSTVVGIINPVFYSHSTEFDPDCVKNVRDTYNLMEVFLKDNYLVGNSMTISDFRFNYFNIRNYRSD